MYTLEEKLLDSWMRITSSISTERLVRKLSYNEVYVCHLIIESMTRGENITARQLCDRMHVLKSQMNKILNKMEQAELIERKQSNTDKRAAYITLTVKGQRVYYDEHESALEIMKMVTGKIGSQESERLIETFSVIIQCFDNMEEK